MSAHLKPTRLARARYKYFECGNMLDRSSAAPMETLMRFCLAVAMVADLMTIIVGLIILAEKLV